MKNLFLLSIILVSVSLPKASFALMSATPQAQSEISNIHFANRILVEIADPRISDLLIHKCEPTPSSYGNDHLKYKVIGTIQKCHLNVFFFNQFYFLQKNNKTYFRQLKTLEARTFEVLDVESDKIQLGNLVEFESVTRPENNFSKF